MYVTKEIKSGAQKREKTPPSHIKDFCQQYHR